jgi:hypothetical protein
MKRSSLLKGADPTDLILDPIYSLLLARQTISLQWEIKWAIVKQSSLLKELTLQINYGTNLLTPFGETDHFSAMGNIMCNCETV